MLQKQLRQCNFILKCKSYISLVLQARTTNANKMLITQRLCAFLALAQLLRNFVFLFFCSFSFNLTDTCIASPSFLTLMRKKSHLMFLHVWRILFSPVLSQFCELQKNLYQLKLVVLYVGEPKT